MKFLKLAFISIAVLFLIITGLGLLLPSTVRVTRNITLPISKDSLYPLFAELENWSKWMEGVKQDNISFATKQKSGAGTVAWIAGRQIKVQKSTGDLLETVWQTSHNTNQLGVFQFYADPSTNSTNVNWYFEQKVGWYPWERLSTLANDEIIGTFMEHSLDNLRTITQTSSLLH